MAEAILFIGKSQRLLVCRRRNGAARPHEPWQGEEMFLTN
jgi:hypothetical protein